MAFRRTLHDLAAAARGLGRRPLVPTVLAVVAVGVAFLVSTFSALDALLWRPLTIGPHWRYLMLGEARRGHGGGTLPYAGVDLYVACQDALERGG